MVFTTLETTPGITAVQRRALMSLSPGRIFAPTTYPTMVARAGLSLLQERDVTRRFVATLRALIAANERLEDALIRERGRAAFEGDLGWYRHRLTAAREGLIRRMLYVTQRQAPQDVLTSTQ
jgi:hypothetical protein